MSNNQTISTFPRSRRKQIDVHRNHFLIEQENHMQSTGDHLFFEQIPIQPATIMNSNDYFYMIYLFLLSLFYFYYLRMILRERTHLFDDNEQYENYEREIPRLLWFRKGHRLH